MPVSLKWLACVGLIAATLCSCRTEPPPVAEPLAHGPAGPTPDIGSGPPQTPPPPAPNNEDIAVAAAVRTNLRSEPGLGGAAERIRVKVSKGIVTLQGALPPAVDHQALISRLEKLPGVDRIEDQLQVPK